MVLPVPDSEQAYALDKSGGKPSKEFFNYLKSLDDAVRLAGTGLGWINVKDPQFGAVGDGVTDDTEAFKKARDYIQSLLDAGKQSPPFYVPAGDYIIKEAGAFWNIEYTGIGFGLIIQGDGLMSQIHYQPVASNPLFDVADSLGRIAIRDLYFDCNDGNSDFMHSDSTGRNRALGFENVWWSGTWRYIVDVSTSSGDATTNSEMSFRRCFMHGEWQAFMHLYDKPFGSDNFVNFWFHQIAYQSASPWIKAFRGGHFKITDSDVSDWFPASRDFLFHLFNNDKDFQSAAFMIDGLRVEQFNSNAGILYSEWGGMAMHGISNVVGTFTNTPPWPDSYEFNVNGAGQDPTAHFDACAITGQVKVSGIAANPGHGMVSFNSCQFYNYDDPTAAVIAPGLPSIHFRNCSFSQTGMADIICDPPTTKTADFSVIPMDSYLICNKAGSNCTVTLPAASRYYGREITFQNYQAGFAVVSASANIVALGGGAPGTALVAAGSGKWTKVVSDGVNWATMQGN